MFSLSDQRRFTLCCGQNRLFTDDIGYAMIETNIEKDRMRHMLVFLIGGVVLVAVIIAVVASVAGAVAAVTDEENEE